MKAEFGGDRDRQGLEAGTRWACRRTVRWGRLVQAGTLPVVQWHLEGAARRFGPGPALVRRGAGSSAAWLPGSEAPHFQPSLQDWARTGHPGQESEVRVPEEGPRPAAASTARENEDAVRCWTVLSAERSASGPV